MGRVVREPVGPKWILSIFLKPFSIGPHHRAAVAWAGTQKHSAWRQEMMTVTLPNHTASASDLNVSVHPGL